MRIFTITLLLLWIFSSPIKAQTGPHPKKSNSVRLMKEGEVLGEGLLYDLTDSALVVYEDNRIGKHDTLDRTLLKSYPYHDIQIIKLNPGNRISGLLLAGFIGSAVGSLAGFGIARINQDGETSMESSQDVLLGFIVGFVVGGIAGTIPGYIHGKKQEEKLFIGYDYAKFTAEKQKLRLFCFKK